MPLTDATTAKAREKNTARTRYRVFQGGDDGGLMPIRTVEARTPHDAVKAVVGASESTDAVHHAPHRYVVIPERNITEITVEIKTETRVVFK